METPRLAPPLPARVLEGLERVATAIRADDWGRARAAGVNPTQLAILGVLDGRPAGLAVRDLALQLGVAQPTATDSILSLQGKGLVEKHPEPGDGRSQRVRITEAGRASQVAGAAWPGAVGLATASLPADDQEHLLLLVVALIRQLQECDAIPIQRMCVSCRHFRPYAHTDATKPHHCNFVDAAFGRQDLRIDCREHETADPSVRAATWTMFEGSHSPPPSR